MVFVVFVVAVVVVAVVAVVAVVVVVRTDDLTRMCIHTHQGSNAAKEGRTPGSQTNGVTATP